MVRTKREILHSLTIPDARRIVLRSTGNQIASHELYPLLQTKADYFPLGLSIHTAVELQHGLVSQQLDYSESGEPNRHGYFSEPDQPDDSYSRNLPVSVTCNIMTPNPSFSEAIRCFPVFNHFGLAIYKSVANLTH